MCIVDDKIQYKTLCAVKCCNYNTWKLFAWWLHIQFGLSYRCNPHVGVPCMWVYLNPMLVFLICGYPYCCVGVSCMRIQEMPTKDLHL